MKSKPMDKDEVCHFNVPEDKGRDIHGVRRHWKEAEMGRTSHLEEHHPEYTSIPKDTIIIHPDLLQKSLRSFHSLDPKSPFELAK